MYASSCTATSTTHASSLPRPCCRGPERCRRCARFPRGRRAAANGSSLSVAAPAFALSTAAPAPSATPQEKDGQLRLPLLLPPRMPPPLLLSLLPRELLLKAMPSPSSSECAASASASASSPSSVSIVPVGSMCEALDE